MNLQGGSGVLSLMSECQLWLYGQVACHPELNPARQVVPEEEILCGSGQGTTIELVASAG